MGDPEKPPTLRDLDERLKVARARQETDQRPSGRAGAAGSGMGFGFRIATDLIVGLVVGIAIGLGLDTWLGTKPWLMIVFFFLGAAAGILNVYRTATGQSYAVGYQKGDDVKGGATEEEAADDDTGARG
ncbi:MAG: AtpZ/AtpI family protein [Pseudomonadota bacterium]